MVFDWILIVFAWILIGVSFDIDLFLFLLGQHAIVPTRSGMTGVRPSGKPPTNDLFKLGRLGLADLRVSGGSSMSIGGGWAQPVGIYIYMYIHIHVHVHRRLQNSILVRTRA